MNIKRAFMAAAAALMVPGFAIAQVAPTTFDTNLVVDQDYGDTVTVMLSCNAGVPLEQSFDIDPDNGVVFVVEELVADANTVCTISLMGLASGLSLVGVNVGDGPELGASSCTFVGDGGDDSGLGTTTLAEANSCDLWAQADAFTSFGLSRREAC